MTLREKSVLCAHSVREYLHGYLGDERIEEMKKLVQHGDVTTYAHCFDVACCSLYLARGLRWRIDEKSLVVGAFLHDFYLYDWHIRKRKGRLHGLCHPALAAKNAREIFAVNDKVYYIVRAHMFPLTPLSPPRSKEGWIVCLADKICAFGETVKGRDTRLSARG